jgi:hypothetical protein
MDNSARKNGIGVGKHVPKGFATATHPCDPPTWQTLKLGNHVGNVDTVDARQERSLDPWDARRVKTAGHDSPRAP